MKHIINRYLSSLSVSAVLAALAWSAFARMAMAQMPCLAADTPQGLIDTVLCPIATWVFDILIVLAIVFVVAAAYKYLTSSGDPEKVKGATKTITYAAVAVVVALLAKGFPFIVINFFYLAGSVVNITSTGC